MQHEEFHKFYYEMLLEVARILHWNKGCWHECLEMKSFISSVNEPCVDQNKSDCASFLCFNCTMKSIIKHISKLGTK